jgi:6-phosphofructokinase 1
MADKVTKIGVLTSGGDAPGMNAAIRAVVRTAIYHGLEVYGVMRGYQGMIDDDIYKMESKSVANIIQRGGTILKTARCKDFFEVSGRKKAYLNLKKRGINGLVIIGGDGSFRGGKKFHEEFDIPSVGIPGTIDRDIVGTDFTIGFDTAVNTAVGAIDKIRDTMDAHDRMFIIEVMGRDAGFIALHSGIATGAEHIIIPERKTDVLEMIRSLQEKEKRKKLVNLIIVAEGDDEFGGAAGLNEIIKQHLPDMDTRICVLGHIQRGGSPTCLDRVIASRMGYHAVECLMNGTYNIMIGIKENRINHTPFEKAAKMKTRVNDEWMKIVKILAS